MPHVIVKLAAGHSAAEKEDLTGRILAAVTDSVGSGIDEVSIALEEIPMQDWMEQVYAPDIAGRAGTLVKRPGYGSLA